MELYNKIKKRRSDAAGPRPQSRAAPAPGSSEPTPSAQPTAEEIALEKSRGKRVATEPAPSRPSIKKRPAGLMQEGRDTLTPEQLEAAENVRAVAEFEREARKKRRRQLPESEIPRVITPDDVEAQVYMERIFGEEQPNQPGPSTAATSAP